MTRQMTSKASAMSGNMFNLRRWLSAGMMVGALVAAPLVQAQQAATASAPAAGESAAAAVSASVQDTVKSAVQKIIGPNGPKVGEVRETPIKGMYEVEVSRHLLYIHESGDYGFVEGNLIDLKNRRDLTQARMTELSRIDFKKDLPLDKAIKQVNGKGERVLAIFEDPNCSYCRRMRSVLSKMDNLTIYTFTYPILAESSRTKSEKAWCAKDPAKAWADLMENGKEPENEGGCKTPIADVVALGQQLQVTGTPTLFFPDGTRVPGAIPLEQLEQMLDKQSAVN